MKRQNPKQILDFKRPSSSKTIPKPTLKQTVEFLSSLISFSHAIKVFTVKWQLIRTKLEELNAGLIAIEDCDSSQSTILSNLVCFISADITESFDLAKRCVDLSYSGKLLMQSDLDVIASKFDQHLKNLSGLCTAGILSQGFALVVSKPGSNACKDDLRFYVRDLFTRMKIGDCEMKRQALVNLYDVFVQDERYMKIILEAGDLVRVLLSFLDSKEVEIQEQASKVVALISGYDSSRSVLINAGIIGPLIRVLENGTETGKESAAKSLQNVTKNSDNAWSVSAYGGVTALLKLCSNGDSRTELIVPAFGVLRNLVSVDEIKKFMIEEGVISTIIKLCSSKDEAVQITSIEFLQNIASADEPIRQLVVREGAIRALVRVLDPKVPYSPKSRETALRTIGKLCFSSANSVNLLMDNGIMDRLLYFLRNGDVSVQELALKLAFRLSGASEDTKKAMGDAGFMPEFVRFLDAKSFEVRNMAAEALCSMVSLPKNRKRFVQDDRNFGFLLQMLDQEEANSGDKSYLISILMSLTNCHSARKKIVNSGYLKNIEKLAEAEVSDAKKLVRKISTNRFRSFLNGIWHS